MTEPDQPAPVDVDAAHLALDAAVAQLVQPSTERLDRADGQLDEHVAAQRAQDRAVERELEARHAKHLRARHAAQARRVLEQLSDHRRRVEERRGSDAVTATTGAVPSLLDQLRDAVQSSSSTGGAASAGAHRSPIGLAAAELLAHIEREVGRGPIRQRVRLWAEQVRTWADEQPEVLAHAAQLAEQWVATGRGILNPQRRLVAKGACPQCGRTTVHQPDDTGEVVRRPALELHVGSGTASARCIAPGCGAHWPAGMLQHLARVLEEQAQERAG